MKKKIISIIIIAALVLTTLFTLAACDGGKKTTPNDGKLVLKDGMTAAEIALALTNAHIDNVTTVATYVSDGKEVVRTTKGNKTSYYREKVTDGKTEYIDYRLFENGRYYEYSYYLDYNTKEPKEETEIYDLKDNKPNKAEMDGVALTIGDEGFMNIFIIAKLKGKGIDKDIDEYCSVKVENNDSIVLTLKDSVVVYKDFNTTVVPLPDGMKGYSKKATNKENAEYEKDGDGVRLKYIPAPILTYVVPTTATLTEKDADNNDVTNTYNVISVEIDDDMMEYTLATIVKTVKIDEDYVGQIVYKGTIEQWKKVTIESYANKEITVHCADGDTTVVAPKGE